MRRFHRSDSEGENVAKPKRPQGAPRMTPCYMQWQQTATRTISFEPGRRKAGMKFISMI